MARRKKGRRWGMPSDRQEPMIARMPILCLLLNFFIWVGFRNMDKLLVGLASVLVALTGTLIGRMAIKRLRRHGGRVSGEGMARIGYWGNLVVLVLAGFLWVYLVLLAILRGEIL
jgi:hypothetical protein